MATGGTAPDTPPDGEVPPKGWHVGQVTVVASKGPEVVAGWVSALFGLDFRPVWFAAEPLPCGYGWCVTHLPTGCAAFGVIMGLADAMAIADELAALPGMDQVGAMDARFMKPRLRPLISRISPRIVHVTDMVPPWTPIDDPSARPDGIGA
jgi:hypothetical protein